MSLIEISPQSDCLGLGKTAKGITGLIQHAIDVRLDNPAWRARKEEKASLIKLKGLIKRQGLITSSDIAESNELKSVAKEALADEIGSTNAADIIIGAMPSINDDAPTDQLDQEWMSHFIDFSRHVYDEDMKSAWSKVLSKEANDHGTVSKRTLFLLASLSKEEALAFRTICSISIGGVLFLDNDLDEFHQSVGITRKTISMLEKAGLIENAHMDMNMEIMPGTVEPATIEGHTVWTLPKQGKEPKIPIGRIMFTSDGLSLLDSTDVESAEGLLDHYISSMRKHAEKVFVCDEGAETALDLIRKGLV